MRYKKSLFISLVLIGVASTSWFWLSTQKSLQHSYDTTKLVRRDIVQLVDAVGILEPETEFAIGTIAFGTIQAIEVGVGSKVKRNDVLIRLTQDAQNAKLKQMEAKLDAQIAQQRVRLAEIDRMERKWRTKVKLGLNNVASRHDVLDAQSDLEIAKYTLEQISAEIRETEISLAIERQFLDASEVRSPIDGTVLSISAQPGQILVSGQDMPSLISVGDITSFKVIAQVSEADVLRIEEGMTAKISFLFDTSLRFEAKVEKVLPKPQSQNGVRLYSVELKIPQIKSSKLLPGITAQVQFVTSSSIDVLTLPRNALDQRDGSQFVKVIKSGELLEKQVSIGKATREYVQITSGLSESDQVVVPYPEL